MIQDIEKVLFLAQKKSTNRIYVYKPILNMIYLENVNNNWNFDYDMIEDLQFTKYEALRNNIMIGSTPTREAHLTMMRQSMIVKLERLVFLLFLTQTTKE